MWKNRRERYWNSLKVTTPLPAEGKVHHICFKVDSLKEEIERLKKHGVTFLLGEEIETLPDGTRYIFFAGPDGEWIEFLRRRDEVKL